METKQCTKCFQHKPFTDFNPRIGGKYGLNASCKACYKAYSDSTSRRDGLSRYGMTEAQYDQMLKDQGGGCAICGDTQMPPHQKFMAVDHCHETMKVRGILCANCNHALGHFKDNVESLKKAIDYLTKEHYAFTSRR
jgi:hypothetical protein